MCAIHETGKSEKGQVVDASMVEGSGALMHKIFALKGMDDWTEERESNLVDGAAHFYDTYETKDGKYVSIASIEPQFHALLLELADLPKDEFSAQMDKSQWPLLTSKLEAVMKTKTRDEWCKIIEGTDVCFAPVLSMSEVLDHPQNQARNSFVEIDGVIQAAPAPKFSRTQPSMPAAATPSGNEAKEILKKLGYSDSDITRLREVCALA